MFKLKVGWVIMFSEKVIIANKAVIFFQLTALLVDIAFSFLFDVSVYFLFAFIVGAIVILYNGILQSVFRSKVIFKDKKYVKCIKRHPYSFTDLRIYNKAKKTKDKKVKTVLLQGFVSVGIILLNFVYILIITAILHPENIG